MSEPIIQKKLEGKVVIVTGAASGIGEATSRVFADNGVRVVVIADIQDHLGMGVVTSIGHNRAAYFHCDVTDEEQVKSLIDWTLHNYGRLDVMFSNAGVLCRKHSILDMDLKKDLDRLLSVNVRGMAAAVKHAARAMVEGGIRGSIICTGSVAASIGSPNRAAYAVSKHAVLGLVRSACCDLGKYGIRVNCISPFSVATPMLCGDLGMDEEGVERAYAELPRLKGLVLKVRHVADAALFLASDDSAFVSGHDLVVDGGFCAR